jgi:hypothetical protein
MIIILCALAAGMLLLWWCVMTLSSAIDATVTAPELAPAAPATWVEPDDAPVLPDAELDRWGKIYRSNPRIAARGIPFDTFVRAPQKILAAVIVRADQVPEDVVDAHIMRVERLLERDRRRHDLVQRGGGLVEPMHHHRHYKPAPSRHNPKILSGSRTWPKA